MNDDIYNLTSEYPEFIENKESFTFLNQLEIFNDNIMKILNEQPIENNNNSDKLQNGHTSSNEQNNNNNNNENTNEAEISLPELIQLLVATDIRPIEYDQELLINSLISSGITNSNVVENKDKMINILEDCKFPTNRAQFTVEQIVKNFDTQKQAQASTATTTTTTSSTTNTTIANTSSSIMNGDRTDNINNNNGDGDEDENGMMVTDITIMAIEGVFEGSMTIQRYEIEGIYQNNDINTHKITHMTESEYSIMLHRELPILTKGQCVKIHRAIKALLDVPLSFRYDINIGLAIIYLINEDNTFTPKDDIIIKPEAIIAAFKQHSAKQILKMGKKSFIKLLQTQTHIKMGHGTKLWNSIKSFIEDSNVVVPQQIIIPNYKDDEDENEIETQPKKTENQKDDDYKKPEKNSTEKLDNDLNVPLIDNNNNNDNPQNVAVVV
eukprot:CAMPEP_0201584748 /NCGR_PEP_ID=MMETSP0190_2-20130828/114369_1 /ASSEMBLY_ACC=CAM_ASM_000263 /TAXON_ID=37353 /ORGANISM="Rosalina sp." /LENGTH=438 /DNA_ID=CAMNT_0048029335 /DNA_START=173 /DNA_END=1489 /DNA_ORIENTATION=-